ncbi:hypothetical protein ACFL2U_02340 [Patescibacteria group bacterium]
MRRRYSRYSRGLSIKEYAQMIGLALLALAIVGGSIYGAAIAGGKMTTVITHNMGYWIVMLIAVVFGVFRKLTNPKEFTWLELPIQLIGTFVVITALFFAGFTTSTDLVDTEIWNGQVSRAEFYEEWTEECTETYCCAEDDKGNCTSTCTRTYNVHHPPEWKLLTSIGEIDVSRNIYNNYVQHWQNQREKDLSRLNQVSIGDGDMYYVTLHSNLTVPATKEKHYVNYLRASDSIRKISGSISGHQNLIRSYPRVHSSQFGPIEVNRVVLAGVNPPPKWVNTLDRQLDLALVHLGSSKQVNILVYLVNTADQGFSYALEEQWVRGKKNDVIVIIGTTSFPKTDFCYVMAWTKVEEFKIVLRDRIMEIPDISDPQKLAQTITSQISKGPQNGGFDRMPMADLEYLIADIKLPWWCQVLIVLIGGAACWLISWGLIKKDVI